ncbi:hypothetical protein [Methyloterricola oryzae]|uniref:hypothetical protein n=1 Tax=Methyloterricola oryzae TaxID=1495050 RepID=UPI0005EB39C8|nr:hypothetical protein [Methyloterricola oryzae]
MTTTLSKQEQLIALGLCLLMAATRSHHFASATHLPDASWAVFFLAGFYVRRLWMLAGLMLLAGVSDYLAVAAFGVNDFCISAAYGFLVPAYAALWFAGRWYASRHRMQWASLLPFAASATAGAVAAELLSSGGFYVFSGRFADLSLATFGERLALYFPQNLEGLALYLGVAVIAHSALYAARPALSARA